MGWLNNPMQLHTLANQKGDPLCESMGMWGGWRMQQVCPPAVHSALRVLRQQACFLFAALCSKRACPRPPLMSTGAARSQLARCACWPLTQQAVYRMVLLQRGSNGSLGSFPT